MQPVLGLDAVPITLVSGDSKYKSIAEFKKSGSTDIAELKGFFGSLAIGVEVEDLHSFQRDLLNCLKTAFEESGYDQLSPEHFESPICSKDIRQFTEGEHHIHNKFISLIRHKIKTLHVLFSAFDTNRIPAVHILGHTRNPEKVHPKVLAIEHLTNSFPHICIWRLLGEIKQGNIRVHVDHFDGKRTRAWETIEAEKINLEVAYKGDECDAVICAADILLRCLTARIERAKGSYNYASIEQNLDEFFNKQKLRIYKIDSRHYPDITPRDQRNIPLGKYLRRPVVFVIEPKTQHVNFSFFLGQPGGRRFLNFIYQKKACYKRFDQGQDRAILKDGDSIVYLDDDGKRAAELIKEACGSEIDVLSYSEIIKKKQQPL